MPQMKETRRALVVAFIEFFLPPVETRGLRWPGYDLVWGPSYGGGATVALDILRSGRLESVRKVADEGNGTGEGAAVD